MGSEVWLHPVPRWFHLLILQALTACPGLCGTQESVLPEGDSTVESRPQALPDRMAYSGERISLELKNADVKDFFRLIGEISGLNIVLDPDVGGSLTLFLKDVPWDQALDVVLRNHSMGRHLDGNVLRIANLSTLQAEQEQRQRLAQARVAAADLQTRTRVPSYAKAAELSLILKKALSPRGDIMVDERTNSMIISDVPEKFAAIEALIQQLDRKIRQVEIEARVVAASRNFLRDIGVQWSARFNRNAQDRTTDSDFISPFSRFALPETPLSTGGTAGAKGSGPLSLNLQANATASPLAFAIGFATEFILDTLITAAEHKGNAKLLSKPKILTQNNIEGVVKQGIQIPVQTTVNNTVSVRFIDFVLRLTVTPQITEEGAIVLSVDIENSTPDFSRQIQGIPTVNTHQTTTTILVENGGTVVIGGILIDSEHDSVSQVPGLGSIPILGYLFRNRSVVKDTRELLFFLSPRIL